MGNGYYQDALDLSSRLGQSQVWIAFHFYSNSSGTSAGFTIDDITLNIDATGSKIFLPGIVNNWSAPEPSPTPGPPPSSDLPCLYAVNWWRDDSPPYGLLHSTYAPACLMPESPTFQPDYGPQGQWIGYTASLSRPSKPDFDMDADYIFNSGGGVEGANVTKTYVGGYVYQMQITRFCPKVGQLTGYKVKVSAPPYNGREETVGSCP